MKKLFRNVLSSCLALALSAGNLLPDVYKRQSLFGG